MYSTTNAIAVAVVAPNVVHVKHARKSKVKITKSQLKQIIKEELEPTQTDLDQSDIGIVKIEVPKDPEKALYNSSLHKVLIIQNTPEIPGPVVDPKLAVVAPGLSARKLPRPIAIITLNDGREFVADLVEPGLLQIYDADDMEVSELFTDEEEHRIEQTIMKNLEESKMKLTKSQLKQIIKEEALALRTEESVYGPYVKMGRPRWKSIARTWFPEHISQNKELWLAAYRAHTNPNPTPEDTRVIQQLQASLANFDAGEYGKFGENMNVAGLIMNILEKRPMFIPGALNEEPRPAMADTTQTKAVTRAMTMGGRVKPEQYKHMLEEVLMSPNVNNNIRLAVFKEVFGTSVGTRLAQAVTKKMSQEQGSGTGAPDVPAAGSEDAARAGRLADIDPSEITP